MKERFKTTSFWLGISGAIVIVLESISNIFDIDIASGVAGDIVLSICSVLVLLGIVTKKNVSDDNDSSKDELLTELQNTDKENNK